MGGKPSEPLISAAPSVVPLLNWRAGFRTLPVLIFRALHQDGG